MLAICPNNNEIWIFSGCKDPDTSKWNKEHVLKEHDLLVSGLDWHPVTNQIVSCSHDRNAFVWSLDASKKKWKPTVVLLKTNRANLDVKWSPDGKKFAVSSGNKSVMVCWYDGGNDWWVSRVAKKAKSSVLAISWHPSGLVLATASTDYRCRVVSAVIEEVDGSSSAVPQFGGILPDFGESIVEFEETKSWIHDCSWSPSGAQLAFLGHDGLLHVVAFHPQAAAAPVLVTVKPTSSPVLPSTEVLFASEDVIVAAGHAMNPEVFVRAGGAWTCAGYVDKQQEAGAAGSRASSSFGNARAMFAAKVNLGQSSPVEVSGEWMKHQGAITCLQAYAASAGGKVEKFSASGNDGRIVVWQVPAGGK